MVILMERSPCGGEDHDSGDDENDGANLVGRVIRQKFIGCGWHEGKVVRRLNNGLFHVRYGDSDERELAEKELYKWL
eukprot:SAG31_NODE_22569_length_522_cov_1.713948_1_plen_76_part_10